jgi:hypothetical protein
MAIQNWPSTCASEPQAAGFSYPYIWTHPNPSIPRNNLHHAAKLAEPAVGAVTEDQDKRSHSHCRTVTSVMCKLSIT